MIFPAPTDCTKFPDFKNSNNKINQQPKNNYSIIKCMIKNMESKLSLFNNDKNKFLNNIEDEIATFNAIKNKIIDILDTFKDLDSNKIIEKDNNSANYNDLSIGNYEIKNTQITTLLSTLAEELLEKYLSTVQPPSPSPAPGSGSGLVNTETNLLNNIVDSPANSPSPNPYANTPNPYANSPSFYANSPSPNPSSNTPNPSSNTPNPSSNAPYPTPYPTPNAPNPTPNPSSNKPDNTHIPNPSPSVEDNTSYGLLHQKLTNRLEEVIGSQLGVHVKPTFREELGKLIIFIKSINYSSIKADKKLNLERIIQNEVHDFLQNKFSNSKDSKFQVDLGRINVVAMSGSTYLVIQIMPKNVKHSLSNTDKDMLEFYNFMSVLQRGQMPIRENDYLQQHYSFNK